MIEEHHEDAEETEQVVRGTGRGRENTEYDHLSSLLLQKMETSLSGLLTTSGVCHKIPFPPTQSKALSMVFTFIYFTLVGFLRGIKNTRIPMIIFATGAAVFVVAAYVLIFGNFGFPVLGLKGAAIAGIIQFGLMASLAFGYVLFSPSTRQYKISFLRPLDYKKIKALFNISAPIMLDKASMAVVPVWLGNSFSFLGKISSASFSAIKDLERLVLLPSNALGQVSTLLVSNELGQKNWKEINNTIKRLLVLWVSFSFASLILLMIFRVPIIRLFDQKNTFTVFSASAFLLLGPLMLLDSMQLLLSGILRGAKRVRVVLYTRLAIVFGIFIPITYVIRKTSFESELMKFLAIYVVFYVCTGIMGVVYWYYIKHRLNPQHKE